MTTLAFCDLHHTGNGIGCGRCGCWWADGEPRTCPPFITRTEPDGKRLPHIKTREENHRRWLAYVEADKAGAL